MKTIEWIGLDGFSYIWIGSTINTRTTKTDKFMTTFMHNKRTNYRRKKFKVESLLKIVPWRGNIESQGISQNHSLSIDKRTTSFLSQLILDLFKHELNQLTLTLKSLFSKSPREKKIFGFEVFQSRKDETKRSNYQIKSRQCEQNVGVLKNRGINWWSLIL